jgi:hypothetical protein
MPILVGWLLWGIGSALASWVVRLFLTFGVAVVTTTYALPPLKAWLLSYVGGLPSNTIALIGYMGIDRGLSLILSALVIAASARIAIAAKTTG